MKSQRRAHRALCLLVSLLVVLVGPASATWSIVVVDTKTHEVCVASATCIPASNLAAIVPVIVVGKGGGASQSLGDAGAVSRKMIFQGLIDGDSPETILATLEANDPDFLSKQYGIVDLSNDPVTFTGSGAGRAKKGVTGRTGDLLYAIQGNVLAGQRVVDECEAALVNTPGDIAQRVMAAMEAARAFGGDGRCSCFGRPDGCGSPPPDFEKSAHIACMLLAREGDPDGTCVAGDGCANGAYTMRLIIRGLNRSPDPILTLQERFDEFRASRSGRPDGIRSSAWTVDALPADGKAEGRATVQLVDIDGVPLDHGGAQVSVAPLGDPLATAGPVTDHGDGTYSFDIRSGTVAGTARFAIEASDGVVRETLFPYLELRVDPREPLHVGFDEVSAAAGASVPFVVDDPSRPRGQFWLSGSLSGTERGDDSPRPSPELLPFLPRSGPFFPGRPGKLDKEGRAEFVLDFEPGALLPLIGMRLEWTGVVFGHGPRELTNTVAFELLP